MNILVTICARAGSKGVASKNIRDFLGYPICYYTLSALAVFIVRYGREYGDFCLAVNSDSPQLYDQIDSIGYHYLKAERKQCLAGDTASKIDAVRDTFVQAEKQTGLVFDIILDMDLTSPLRKAADIKNVLDVLINTPDADAAISVTEARRNPYFNQFIKKDTGFYGAVNDSDFVTRQQAPEIFDANASLYAYRPGFLAIEGTILTRSKLAVSLMDDTAILDIDSEHDYELLQVIADYFYKNRKDFGEIREEIKTIKK